MEERMKGSIVYEKRGEGTEWISYREVVCSYPMHTHAGHMIWGYVSDGEVWVCCNGKKRLYHTGEAFCILPDTAHEIEAVKGRPYSMSIQSIAVTKGAEQAGDCLMRLKQMISEAPEEMLPIGELAQRIGLSPFYMIRQFRHRFGLTPHQFQIQCRIRKAQRLLEEESSVTEAAYATGFCDQSHFDRCFHKIVRVTPSVYKQCIYRALQ